MKINKEQQARMNGMQFALKIAKEKGIEALEKEVQFRTGGKEFIPLGLTEDLVKGVFMELLPEQSSNLQDLIIVETCMALHDEFGFGPERLKRFANKLNYHTMCTTEKDIRGGYYVRVSDFAEYLNEKCDANFDLDRIKAIEAIEDAYDEEQAKTK